jgi:hypothetical protein
MKTKIQHVEPQFAQKLDDPFKSVLQELRYPIPPGYRLRVSLRDANGKKKRSNADADNWSPVSGRLEIWFEPSPPSQNEVIEETPGRFENSANSSGRVQKTSKASEEISRPTYVHPAESDLVKILEREEADLLRALDRAESKPGWSFVPLKKFRDEILPSEHIPSMRSDVEQRRVLGSAIEKRLILVGKVLNPKSPQFPVTTIRVNRLMPEVKAILGGVGDADLEFRPVEIKGEPLSATVIRERHR